MIKMDYYKILGVEPTATQEEIKTAFRRLAFKYHPDHHNGDRAKEAKFKEASESYEVLCDPVKRAKYDRTRPQPTPPPPPPRQEAPPPPPPSPPRSTPVQSSSGSGAAAAGLGGLFTLGLAALGIWAVASSGRGGGGRSSGGGRGSGGGGRRSGSYYDGTVDRYRGPDGRFRRS
jgi:curved DNA-binding protein CbpA